MEKQEIFIVIENHKDRFILGAFSTEEKAKEFMKSENERLGLKGMSEACTLETHTMDDPFGLT